MPWKQSDQMLMEDVRSKGDRPWASQILGKLLERHRDVEILLVTAQVPEWALTYAGALTVFTAQRPDKAFHSTQFACSEARNHDHLIGLLREMPRAGDRPFDIVFIDHNHGLHDIIAELEALWRWTDRKTLFIFDDAVPPEWDMAGARAKPGLWWVGEVWMLSKVLDFSAPKAVSATVDISPTGLMAAQGFSLPDPERLSKLYADLSALDADHGMPMSRANVSLPEFNTMIDDALSANDGNSRQPIIPVRPLTAACASEPLEPYEPWAKREPAFLLDLSGAEHDLSRLTRQGRMRHGAWLCDFDDVDLIGFTTLLKGSEAFSRYESSSAVEQAASRFGGYENHDTQLSLVDGEIVVARDLANPVRIDDNVYLGTPDEPDNWGMWLFQGVRGSVEFLNRRDRYDKFLCTIRSEWQRKLVTALGIDTSLLIEQNSKAHYRLRKCGLLVQTSRDLALSDADRAAFDRVAARLVSPTMAAPKRIFISRYSRSQKGSYRALKNEAELAVRLEALGFSIIEPELLAFEDQIGIFRSAEVVVGLGGAGMFNAAFCQPGTKLVTIESSTTFLDAHTNIFASLDLDYGVIVGAEDPEDPRPVHKSWSVDVLAVEKALQSFM